LHAVRDVIPLAESAQLSAQLPMLVRGIYFEGWNPARAADRDRSRDAFLRRVEAALERAMWNELEPIAPEHAARAVLRVLTARVAAGEIDHVRQAMPERVRDLWPQAAATG
jgi:uncharacterized protein (DUF2267 family)